MFRRRSLLPVLTCCAWLAVSATTSAQQSSGGQYPQYQPRPAGRSVQESSSRPGMSRSGVQSPYPASPGEQRPYAPATSHSAAGSPDGRVSQAGYTEPSRSRNPAYDPEFHPGVPAGQPPSRLPDRGPGNFAADAGPFPRGSQENAPSRETDPLQTVDSDSRQLPVLRISRDGEEAAGDGATVRRTKSTGSGLWTSFASLAVLILLMLGGAKLWKRHGPRMGSVLPGEAVEVLGRRPVDARHSIVLVRLGSRILVLSAGTSGLQTLAELSDPVEVDFLAGQCRQQAAEGAVAQTFRSLFQLESLRGKEQGTGTTQARPAAYPGASRSTQEAEHTGTSSDPYLHSDYGSESNQHTTDSSFEDAAGETEYSDDPVYYNPEEQLPRQSTGTPHPAASSEERRRSPNPESEAILERLRRHSLSSSSTRPAAAASSRDGETAGGGRQYHEAG